MSHTLIVYGHPYEKSFNHAILTEITTGLKMAGKSYQVIDLHADGFDPTYSTEELALYKSGETVDPLVTKYQKLIDEADSLVILSPIWWGYLTPRIKGFFDKVMKKPWAYIDSPTGPKGKLRHIRKSWVITTAIAPKWYLRLIEGNPIKGTFISTVMKALGLRHARWTHFGQVNRQGNGRHQKFLEKVRTQAKAFGQEGKAAE